MTDTTTAPLDVDSLPPTQDLILDVLATRPASAAFLQVMGLHGYDAHADVRH